MKRFLHIMSTTPVTFTLPTQLRGDAYFHEDNGFFYLPMETAIRRISQSGAVVDFTPTGYDAQSGVNTGQAHIMRKSADRLIISNRVSGASLKAIEIDTDDNSTVASVDITPIAANGQAYADRAFCYKAGTDELIAPFRQGSGLESYGRYKPDNTGHVLDDASQVVFNGFTPKANGVHIFYTTFNGVGSIGFGSFPVAGYPAGPVSYATAIGQDSGFLNGLAGSMNLHAEYGGNAFTVGRNGTADKIAKLIQGSGTTLYTLAGTSQQYTCIASFDDGTLIVVNGAGDVRIVDIAGNTQGAPIVTGLSKVGLAGTVAAKKNSDCFLVGRMATAYVKLYRTRP